ncbi:IclR family transcriptional regulator [Roseomonas populi]|uniref:IclR family transcriptional regulator n=1 Tax=Roseomonas populi TaxID=3121582 RepID=A0ABT1X6G3_9PROT|nr:IclR family transcriptional regulator [Roseomonas pecuniae]MCR0983356.1 IclR family transcriptional regulator [Roseomonas pecuniae]
MPPEKNQIQVIGRAAAVLRALENQPQGLSLGGIAAKVELARSTVQRIVAALESEKLVVAAGPSGRVRLGPALLRLAASVETDVAAIAHPFIAELSASLGETVDFAVVRRDHLVFVDQVIGMQRLQAVSAVGETFPLYCTANGKAYLATLTDEEIESLIGTGYGRRTPNTITTFDALLPEVKKARRAGIAFDREEHVLGISAVGVALRDMLGNPVAISVPVPTQRFTGREKAIAERLLATKHALQQRFTDGSD